MSFTAGRWAGSLKPGNDLLEAMKWRNLRPSGTALDRGEDVANQIESLVLEYS
jgi:hypothetical protein